LASENRSGTPRQGSALVLGVDPNQALLFNGSADEDVEEESKDEK